MVMVCLSTVLQSSGCVASLTLLDGRPELRSTHTDRAPAPALAHDNNLQSTFTGPVVTVTPADNLQELAVQHPAGTTFVLTPGVYRNQVWCLLHDNGRCLLHLSRPIFDLTLFTSTESVIEWCEQSITHPVYPPSKLAGTHPRTTVVTIGPGIGASASKRDAASRADPSHGHLQRGQGGQRNTSNTDP